ncbi:MAG: AAA family ATPase [Desulfovibrionaceae bacterium]|nr:AAA family ATPase [Desulfovibrionaceae bacterium]
MSTYIKSLCPNEVTLLTRPPKFGKSLTLSMLKAFFEIQKDPYGTATH